VTVWALIAAKSPGQGKTRLAAVLSPRERGALVEAMLRHVVGVAQGVADRTLLTGPRRGGWDTIEDPGGGLNPALMHALRTIAAVNPPDRLVVLAADLPRLAPEDMVRLASVPGATVGIAPDRHGTGTNALSLPLPHAAAFAFHYGAGSAARHRAEADRLRLNAVTITSPGLAKDIDEPSDLADAGRLFSPSL
jgi:2-phospho-L-lactate guanylyltransferase